MGWTGHDDALARRALKRAYEAGIRHWDTADVYGDGRAERLIGSVWGEVRRADVFLASKVGWDPGPHDHYYHPDQIRRQMERTLRNLRTECLDLYYLHHCDFGPNDEYLDDAVAAVLRFRDEGKIRFVGASDWECERVVRHVERIRPDVVQVYRNVMDDTFVSSGLGDWVEAHDVGVAFFSPLRHGLLLGKYDAPPRFGEGDFRGTVDEFRDEALVTRLRENRDRLIQRFPTHPQPVLHGLLGPLLEDTPSACVLVGMRNPDQVDAAAESADPMEGDDAAWVRTLYRRS